LLLVFFLFSLLFAILGLGGGVIYVPVQLFQGVAYDSATTLSLFLITTTSFSSTIFFAKKKLVDWGLVFRLEISAIFGSFLSGFILPSLEERVKVFLFISVLFINAILMFLPSKISNPGLTSRFSLIRIINGETISINMLIAIPLFFASGVMAAFFGVGGGMFMVPIFVLLLNVPMKIAVPNSAVMIGFTAFSGFAGKAFVNKVDWSYAIFAAVIVFVGSRIGASISLKIEERILKRMFSAILLLATLVLAIRFIYA